MVEPDDDPRDAEMRHLLAAVDRPPDAAFLAEVDRVARAQFTTVTPMSSGTAAAEHPRALDAWDGQVYGGRFEVEAVLGAGGMGVVYRARDRVLERLVAVKVLRPEVAASSAFVARFFVEARVVASLSPNPHVVSIYDVGRAANGSPYLVMEYLPGQTLQAFLDHWSPPSRSWVLRTGIQISSALLDAHASGVIHRDLKPGNVFLLEAHTLPFLLKVLDFGLARSKAITLAREHATQPGSVSGTPRYVAPELFAGEEPSTAVDVYALGLVLYELAAGRSPYSATTPVEFLRAHVVEDARPLPDAASLGQRYDYPPAFRDLLAAMLSKSPRARPSASDCLRELARMLEGIAHR